MNIIDKLFSGTVGKLADTVAGVADRFIQTDDEKAAFKLEAQKVMEQHFAAEAEVAKTVLDSKMQVVVAELKQGDKYTSRARPTLAYFGMVVIAINYVIAPLAFQIFHYGTGMPLLGLPDQFWWAWGGVTGTWAVGRTMEKAMGQSRTSNALTWPDKKASPAANLLED